jgi:hypothetical protein
MGLRDCSNVDREKGAWLVRYELWRLRESYEASSKDVQTRSANNTIFARHSCLIHARNVLDFLYPRERVLAEDIIAEDFLHGWAQLRPGTSHLLLAGHTVKAIRQRLDREFAHLSYARLPFRERDDQLWRYAAPLGRDLLVLADTFLDALDDPERSWFGPIPDGDRIWLVTSMLPRDRPSSA